MDGNVFVFSFSQEGFEAIVNLSAINEQYIMDKLADKTSKQSVNSILSMMEVRARFNAQRKMEVWLVKLDEEFTEEDLLAWADEDPQGVADLARMGEAVFGGDVARERQVIS
jgi:hypothetical protein